MAEPIKWDWGASNGTATAEATTKAFTALTGGGPTSDFAADVWNDILDKISAQRAVWGDDDWDDSILSLENAKMLSGGGMTAARFNSAVANIWPISEWPWAESLGRSTIRRGDSCMGSYFLNLVEGLNRWIEDLEPLYFAFTLEGEVTTELDIRLFDPLFISFLLEIEGILGGSISLVDACIVKFLLSVLVQIGNLKILEAQALIISILISVKVQDAMWARLADALLVYKISEKASVYTHLTVITGYPIYTGFDLQYTGDFSADLILAHALCTGFGLRASCSTACGATVAQYLPFSIDLAPCVNIDVEAVNAAVEKVSFDLNVKTNISVQVSFKEPRLVLASELEDVLVSTLEDRLISYVELDFS